MASKIKGKISNIVSKVKIPSWTSSMASKIKGKISNIVSSHHDDVLITKTGEVHEFNPNDNIIATKNGLGIGGTFNINISINALDASSIDRSLIDKLTSQITESLKRELQGRSSYGIGI
jgi:hypothetical protein